MKSDLIHKLKIYPLDKFIVVLAISFTAIVTFYNIVILKDFLFLFLAVLTFFSCYLYLYLKRKNKSLNFFCTHRPQLKLSNCLFFNTLFLLLFGISILVVFLSPVPYVRPLIYFILITIMTIGILLEVTFFHLGKRYAYFILIKIILIGLSLACLEPLIFPTIVGEDPWWHYWFTSRILENGYISEGYAYSKLPIMHLTIGIASIISNLDYKLTVIFSYSFINIVLDTLFIYLLGNILFNNRQISLLAALLLITTNTHIWGSYWMIPNITAGILILPITYLLFNKKGNELKFISLLLFLMGILILTHTITSVCMAILLFLYWIIGKFYNWLESSEAGILKNNLGDLTTPALVILFTVSMFSWWMYASGHIGTLAELIKWGFSKGFFMPGAATYLYNPPFLEKTLLTLGERLFFAISFLGFFYSLSKEGRNKYCFSFVVSGIFILLLFFLSPLFGKDIIGGRWLYFSQLMLALPVAVGFFLLSGLFKKLALKIISISLIASLLVFLMITNPKANIDNPIFYNKTSIRYAFVDSEIKGLETVSNFWKGEISSDKYLPVLNCDPEFEKVKITGIDEEIIAKNFIKLKGSLIFIRNEITSRPFECKGAIYTMDYDPYSKLKEQGFFPIYDNGGSKAFL